MATHAPITADQPVEDILRKHPQILRVLASFGVGVCCAWHGRLNDCLADSTKQLDAFLTEVNRSLHLDRRKAAGERFSLFLFTGYGLGDLLSSRLDHNTAPLRVEEAAEFRRQHYMPKLLYDSSNLKVMLLCFEKHQSLPIHRGRGDVIFVVLKGKAIFTVGSNRFEARAGHTLAAPAETIHTLDSQERTLVLAFSVAPSTNPPA